MRTSSPLQHTNQTERDWTSCFVLAANVVAISCTGAIFAFSDSKQEKLEFGLLILFKIWPSRFEIFNNFFIQFNVTWGYSSHFDKKKIGFTHAGFVYVCTRVIFGIQLNNKRCVLKLELLLMAENCCRAKSWHWPQTLGSWNKANC